jgi:hypothetical protein
MTEEDRYCGQAEGITNGRIQEPEYRTAKIKSLV